MFFKVLAVIATFALCLNGLRLNCVFMTADWWNIGSHYTCSPATFINDGNSTHILSVTGTHLGGKGNADVKSIDVHDGLQLSRMPKGFEKFFSNLAGVYWWYGSLTSIIGEDLRPFPKLEVIGLYKNKLTLLDGDLFVHTPKISYVHFGDNQLHNVGYGLLDGLNNLTRGNFTINPCIYFAAETPAAIQELKTKLRNQCPPLMTTTTRPILTTTPLTTRTNPTTTVSTTTDSGFCSIGCVQLIKTVEDENVRQNDVTAALQAEVLAQKDQNGLLRIEISGLQAQDSAQQEQISGQSDAIAELHEQNSAQHKQISAQQEQISSQQEQISGQSDAITAQHEQISAQGDAIAELEMQMREFWSSPCSPCVASQYAAQVDQE